MTNPEIVLDDLRRATAAGVMAKAFVFYLERTDAIWFRFTQDNQVMFASKSWSDLTGWSFEETIAVGDFMNLIHPDDIERTKEAWRTNKAATLYRTTGFRNRYRKRDGSYVTFRWMEGIFLGKASGNDVIAWAIVDEKSES